MNKLSDMYGIILSSLHNSFGFSKIQKAPDRNRGPLNLIL